jgi:hypothetical protein
VVAAEYSEDFVALFTINYAAMRYQNRNDQLNHFDGDQARMDLGREKLAVYKEGAEDPHARDGQRFNVLSLKPAAIFV